MTAEKDLRHYELLSVIFQYPDRDPLAALEELEEILSIRYPGAVDHLKSFKTGILALDGKQREEYFVRTFEVEAVCCMDIGYVMFGEDYKRGDFLAQMQHEQNQAGNPLGAELADHLPNVLTLLPRLEDELARELAWCIMVPATGEILKKFDAMNNNYRHAFTMLLNILTEDFSDPDLAQFIFGHAGTEFPGAGQYACGNDFLMETGKPKF